MQNLKCNILDLVFPNADPNDSLVISVVKFLLSVDTFVNEILRTKLNCRNLRGHYCLACGLQDTIENAIRERTVNVTKLKRKLDEVVLGKGKNNEDMLEFGFIDTLSTIMNAIHCDFLRDASENASNSTCGEQCPFHKTFHLGIEEIYKCQCGQTGRNKWEYSTLCQFYSIHEILLNITPDVSKELLGIPNFKLKSNKPLGISPKFQAIILENVKNRLESPTAEYCFNESCQFPSSKIAFRVISAPEIFIINLIWEKSESTHLESLISTISIPSNLSMQQIYRNGANSLYNLKGIVFYGRNHFEYALRHLDNWVFPGVNLDGKWIELLKEITVMNYRPVCAVFEKANEILENRQKNWKLLQLEKLACECDEFLKKFHEEPIGQHLLISGLANKKKIKYQALPQPDRVDYKNPAKVFTEGQDLETKLVKDQNMQEINVKEWKCKCNGVNSDEWEVCQTCHKVKPGLSGWVCEFCNYRNTMNTYRCESCDVSKNSKIVYDQDYWKCQFCATANSMIFSICSKCYEINREKKLEDEEEKKGTALQNFDDWTCGNCKEVQSFVYESCKNCKKVREKTGENYWICEFCEEKNLNVRSFCYSCQKDRKKDEEVKNVEKIAKNNTWVCNHCTFENNDWSFLCEMCLETKDSPSIAKEEPWKCTNCLRDNEKDRDRCEKCFTVKPFNDRSAAIKKCEICKKELKVINCPHCDKGIRYAIKCEYCQGSLLDVETCLSCSEDRNPKNVGFNSRRFY